MATLGALLVPAAAHGQEPPRTDPEAGSPAETVYGIPLEEARRDAAPAALPSSAIRTEQGVGSSARVPGVRQGASGEVPDPEQGAERLRERRRVAARAAARISGESSGVATAMVLILVVAIAAAAGLGAGRLARSRPPT